MGTSNLRWTPVDRVGPDTGCAFDGPYGCTWNDAAGAVGQGAVDLAGALRRGCLRQDASQTGHERCQHSGRELIGPITFTSLVDLKRKYVHRPCERLIVRKV